MIPCGFSLQNKVWWPVRLHAHYWTFVDGETLSAASVLASTVAKSPTLAVAAVAVPTAPRVYYSDAVC